jgi:hypothetical protein
MGFCPDIYDGAPDKGGEGLGPSLARLRPLRFHLVVAQRGQGS